MSSNFDFLENIDKELFNIIEDAQKLFRDEYFNQCVVQVRIFAEKMARKIISMPSEATFDDVLHCLKDRIKTDREKEFIEDLFFIKKEGNASAHGQTVEASTALEVIQRAFEASINYAVSKGNKEADNLLFDTTLLITKKPSNEVKLVDKYLKAAQQEALELEKQTALKLEKEERKQKIKQKVKDARKNLRQNINNINKKEKNKVKSKNQKGQRGQKKSKTKANWLKPVLFFTFVLLSVLFLLKMFCVI